LYLQHGSTRLRGFHCRDWLGLDGPLRNGLCQSWKQVAGQARHDFEPERCSREQVQPEPAWVCDVRVYDRFSLRA